MHLPLIIAGDFNAILNAALDTSNTSRAASVSDYCFLNGAVEMEKSYYQEFLTFI